MLVAASLLAHPAHAGLQNDVPSCYAANHITPANQFGYTRLLYVLIDQTVGWDANFEQAILDNLNSNLTPGTKFVIAEFSAFNQGRYLEVLHTGIIENPMPETQIDNTPIEKTKTFNACIQDQRPFATGLADRSVQSALQASTSRLDHSDIMSALQSVSTAIAADPAPQKLLFLASDGLENSSVASFYRHGSLRNIDPRLEIKNAAGAGLLGNFGGSKVFIIGGALQGNGDAAEDYRSPTLLNNLKTFWQLYFRQSNAILVEFGEPALLQPVEF
jgi:hypothetical protein